MTYEQAIDFIHGRLRLGSKLGLDTTNELLRRVGNPHKKLKFIHVAGTNGKGSTSAYIANILMENGYKTGMYISPYVHSFTERIQINNKQIPKNALALHTEKIISAIDDSLCPTEFEVVTAIGLLHFLHEGCDFVVLEVGLGGRFDATNVIPPPLVSVITSISIDHTELLGDTIEQIALEKSGIIKSGSTVAVYPDNPKEAIDVILNTALSKNVPVKIGDKNDITITTADTKHTSFIYQDEEYEISMLGTHQVYNAVTAITALKLLGIKLELKEGIKKTHFGGRLEIVGQNPLTVIDGAHNFSGVSALKNALTTYFPKRKIILVMGMLRDKEYEKCINEIAPLAHIFIATEPNNPRALCAYDVESIAKKSTQNTVSVKNRQDAVYYAKKHSDEDSVICVCGSLYLFEGLKYL